MYFGRYGQSVQDGITTFSLNEMDDILQMIIPDTLCSTKCLFFIQI